jgi:hypothetical protein
MKKITSFIVALIFFSPTLFAQNQPLPKLSNKTKKDIIDSIRKALNNYYVFPEKAKIMAEYLEKQSQKNGYDTISDPNQFANAVLKDIRAIYNDKHLIIRFDPELEKRIINFISTQKPDKANIFKEQRQNFFFKKIEILPSNIGYIEFTNFADTSQSARETVRAAMKFVAHTDVLILDIRNNFGGNAIMAAEIESYFFKDKIFTGRSFNRIENKWKENWIENKPAITNGLVLDMPVYILTSNRTFSAAEGLAYTLQQMKNAIVIGDTTRGGAHLTRSFSLGNGFVGFIPFCKSENIKTKTDWEGTGIIPDINESETNSLLTAQKTILNRQLASASDENEKRKINWLINFYKSKSSVVTVSESDLRKFIGKFEEFEFSIHESLLFCTNTHQINKIDRLIPISPVLFQIDNESQVEFIADEKGLYSTIKLYWNDGFVDKISKSQ